MISADFFAPPASSANAPPHAAWIAVIFLLAVAAAVRRGSSSLCDRGIHDEDHFAAWLAISSLAALLFLAAQGFAWRQIFSDGALSGVDSSASYFLLFSGVHALLLLGALASNGSALRAGAARLHSFLAGPLSICWNFTTGLWLFLLILLSLHAPAGGG